MRASASQAVRPEHPPANDVASLLHTPCCGETHHRAAEARGVVWNLVEQFYHRLRHPFIALFGLFVPLCRVCVLLRLDESDVQCWWTQHLVVPRDNIYPAFATHTRLGVVDEEVAAISPFLCEGLKCALIWRMDQKLDAKQ